MATGTIPNPPTREEFNALNSKLTNKTEWLRIAEITTTANVNYDQTVSVTVPSYVSEIMFTLQRASNGRTFASTVVPWGQFNGGAIYTSGEYAIYSGTFTDIVNTGTRLISAVAIYVNNSSIEIAINANDEPIKARIFVR